MILLATSTSHRSCGPGLRCPTTVRLMAKRYAGTGPVPRKLNDPNTQNPVAERFAPGGPACPAAIGSRARFPVTNSNTEQHDAGESEREDERAESRECRLNHDREGPRPQRQARAESGNKTRATTDSNTDAGFFAVPAGKSCRSRVQFGKDVNPLEEGKPGKGCGTEAPYQILNQAWEFEPDVRKQEKTSAANSIINLLNGIKPFP